MPSPTKEDDLSACVPPVFSSTTTVKFNAGQFVSRRTNEKISKYYSIKSALGSGGYGEVFLAKHKQSGAERAIKVVNKNPNDESSNKAVLHEFNIVRKLDHPNILKMYKLYQDENYFYIGEFMLCVIS